MFEREGLLEFGDNNRMPWGNLCVAPSLREGEKDVPYLSFYVGSGGTTFFDGEGKGGAVQRGYSSLL